MLEAIDEIIPIGNPDWERVWDRHNAHNPQKEWTAESLRRKVQTSVKKNENRDPNCRLTFVLPSVFTGRL